MDERAGTTEWQGRGRRDEDDGAEGPSHGGEEVTKGSRLWQLLATRQPGALFPSAEPS